MKFRKIIIYTSLLVILLYIFMDVLIYFNYKDDKTSKAITWTTNHYSIPDDSIPENIINAYEKIYPDALTHKIYPDVLWNIISRNDYSYPQIILARHISMTNGIKIRSIANQLDNKLNQKQCIWACLMHTDFLNNARNIKKAAEIYYGKSVHGLSMTESIELVTMFKNPSVYNKYRHQDKLEEKIREVTGPNTERDLRGL